jgi:hypothetical protein
VQAVLTHFLRGGLRFASSLKVGAMRLSVVLLIASFNLGNAAAGGDSTSYAMGKYHQIAAAERRMLLVHPETAGVILQDGIDREKRDAGRTLRDRGSRRRRRPSVIQAIQERTPTPRPTSRLAARIQESSTSVVKSVVETDTLHRRGSLRNDQTLESKNGQARFVVQSDGNMVVYLHDDQVLWESGTRGTCAPGTSHLELQNDGHLVLYGEDGSDHGIVTWKSDTDSARRLVMQNDCNLVLYADDEQSLWASGSNCDPTFAPTDAPSDAPTDAPTSTPTAAPTSTPTAAPTHMPTEHPCNDGSHGCDLESSYCARRWRALMSSHAPVWRAF